MSNNEDSESHGVNQSLQHYNVNPGRHGSGTINRVVDYGFHAHARRRQSSTQTLDAKHVALKFQQSNLPNIPPTEQSTTYIDSPQSEYEGLAHELHRAMVDAYPDCNNTFLPLGELERICQESVVRRELKRAFRNSSTKLVESYTKYVCDDSRNPKQRENTSVKLFAILVLMGKLDMIGDLIEAGIKDRHLPLRKSKTKYPSDFMLVKNEITVNGVLEQITCCENWGSNDKNEFYSRQWGLLSPYFDKAEDGSVVLYDLDEQVIMPWTTIGEQAVGGFSDVMHVTIHKDHHAFAAQSFAIKTPSSEDDIPFEDELQTLKKVEERFHLISVYAAYRKGSEHSFILPWADGGTLLDLWNEDPQSLRSKVFVENHEDTEAQREKLVIRWIASQLVGLTGEFGLGFLHDTHFPRSQWDGKLNAVQTERRYGIHSNIKPTNILHFKQDGQISEQHSIKVVRGLGHLKISGFGLTTFHSTLTRQPRTGPRSATYRPPEFGLESALCSEKIDIWSLGCVMLQFLTWFIGGREALAEFNWKRLEETVYNGLKFREDNFFNITKSGGRTHKSSVQNHIEDLQREIGQNNYLHDCLVLIRTKMLQIDPEKRAGFEEISAILQECYEKHEPVENSPPLSVDGESNFAPPSVFSLPDGSIASSVSSQPEILAASFLRDILVGDPELEYLFKSAFEDPKIGGERLENNFRRILKMYSRDLRIAATDQREQLASKQVRKNARSVARLIREAYNGRPESITADLKVLEGLSSQTRIENYLRTLSSPGNIGSQIVTEPIIQDSSDSEDSIDRGVLEKEPDDNTDFPHIQHVKAFLVSGDPMTKLKENLKSFVYSIPSGRLSSGVAVMRRIWLPQSVPEMVGILFDLFKIPIPEDPKPPRTTRVRWKCQCGTPLYDDFSKLTPENLNALRKQLALNERGSGGTTPSSVSEPIRPRTKGIWDSISQRFLPRRVPSEQSSIELGIRHDMNSPESILQVEDRQILLCIDIGEENMARLHQPSLSKAKVSNDEQLFAFLRNQYWKHRTTPRLFTLRCVKRVWITKFDVDKHNLVELAHPRDRTCKPECMCLPPLDRIKTTEYVCSPAPEKEPQQHPAYSPRRLKHYLEKPHQFETAEKDIYQQLPKRKSQLSVGESKPCLAWGLHFEEDWHWPTIYIYVSVSIFGSLLFGIIWSVTMKGVGDGFTAGSFGVSDCSVLLALAAWRSTSF